MKEKYSHPAICPKCGQSFTEHPALSRLDNRTLICLDCGTREALDSLGIGKKEQDEILRTIHQCYDKQL